MTLRSSQSYFRTTHYDYYHQFHLYYTPQLNLFRYSGYQNQTSWTGSYGQYNSFQPYNMGLLPAPFPVQFFGATQPPPPPPMAWMQPPPAPVVPPVVYNRTVVSIFLCVMYFYILSDLLSDKKHVFRLSSVPLHRITQNINMLLCSNRC